MHFIHRWKTLAWQHHVSGQIRAHTISLTPPLFIEVHVPDRKVSGHVFLNLGYRICPFLRRGRDRMVVCFTTTYVISGYHH